MGELGLVGPVRPCQLVVGVAERWTWMVGGVGLVDAADVDRLGWAWRRALT